MRKIEKLKVIIAMISIIFSAMIPSAFAEDESAEPIMIFGTNFLVQDMDPHYAQDRASSEMIEQIMEGLFNYDLQDKNLAYQPCLAKDFGTWGEGAEGFHGKQWKYTVELKTNITFHDGSIFGADDVKYSFDRLTTLCTTGVNGTPTQIKSLYSPLASSYPATPFLFNATNIIDKNTVEIILNYKYAALEPLLCHTGSVIMPKDKYPVDAYLDKTTDVLIGTGPYTQISSTADFIEFDYFEDFRGAYGQSAPEIRKMKYKNYPEPFALHEAFLAGDCDAFGGISYQEISWGFLDQYTHSSLHVVGDRMQSAYISYFGFDMNNVGINTRKALRSTIDYKRVYEAYEEYYSNYYGKEERKEMTSIIPKGMLFHDETILAPIRNLSSARASIIAAVEADEQGIVTPADWTALKESINDSDWEAVTILSIDYVYSNYGGGRPVPAEKLKKDFAKIGVDLNMQNMEGNWSGYADALRSGELEMYAGVWSPEFNDPSNYINNLAGSASDWNHANVNDSVLDDLIAQGLAETDPVKREQLYKEMQKRIDDLSVFVFMTTSNLPSVYNVGCQNSARNAMGKLYWYLWTFDAGASYYKNVPSFSTLTLIAVCTLSLSILGKKKAIKIKKKR